VQRNPVALVIIRNSKRTVCSNCGGVHSHITKPIEGKPCDTPVAYPDDTAEMTARLLAHGAEDIERIPTGTDIVLAEGARKLPVREEPDLARFTTRTRLA
jgi:hypothetical protein